MYVIMSMQTRINLYYVWGGSPMEGEQKLRNYVHTNKNQPTYGELKPIFNQTIFLFGA